MAITKAITTNATIMTMAKAEAERAYVSIAAADSTEATGTKVAINTMEVAVMRTCWHKLATCTNAVAAKVMPNLSWAANSTNPEAAPCNPLPCGLSCHI